ncbi:hypothetical protein [Agriterribacter sp.]|uniref:DUF7710 domain-containing protein n=1 Tax=Agriterribacter sp. TaxID=2821509 RepID=UPI002CBBB034|nr:hypothetical protein [Agriterribacter sp.]HRP55609.1 hypothetical protein [Agriterribacter sp.]
MNGSLQSVWIFNSEEGKFPGGIFSDKAKAENWIREHKLTGVLTLYPLNEGAYDWALNKGYFTPSKEKEKSPNFIGSFSSASQQHYHYLDGEPD